VHIAQRSLRQGAPQRPLSGMTGSLLDVALEGLDAAGRGLQPVARVCLLGQLAADVLASDHGHWCASHLSPQLTGLLLLLPGGWLHTIEGPYPELAAFLKMVAAEQPSKIAGVRIIAAQEDVRSRCFPHWSYKEASVQRSNYAEIDADGVPALLADTQIGEWPPRRALQRASCAATFD
jgi:hypothetical protein